MPTESEIKELLTQRSSFIDIKARIAERVEPRIFSLLVENISNVRNTIVIAGALASIGILIFDKYAFVFIENFWLIKFAVVAYLLCILVYSFYLKLQIEDGVKSHQNLVSENSEVLDDAQRNINDCLDGKITKKKFDEKMIEVYQKIEFTKFRKPNDKKEQPKGAKLITMLARLGNICFVAATIALIIGMLDLPILSIVRRIFCLNSNQSPLKSYEQKS